MQKCPNQLNFGKNIRRWISFLTLSALLALGFPQPASSFQPDLYNIKLNIVGKPEVLNTMWQAGIYPSIPGQSQAIEWCVDLSRDIANYDECITQINSANSKYVLPIRLLFGGCWAPLCLDPLGLDEMIYPRAYSEFWFGITIPRGYKKDLTVTVELDRLPKMYLLKLPSKIHNQFASKMYFQKLDQDYNGKSIPPTGPVTRVKVSDKKLKVSNYSTSDDYQNNFTNVFLDSAFPIQSADVATDCISWQTIPSCEYKMRVIEEFQDPKYYFVKFEVFEPALKSCELFPNPKEQSVLMGDARITEIQQVENSCHFSAVWANGSGGMGRVIRWQQNVSGKITKALLYPGRYTLNYFGYLQPNKFPYLQFGLKSDFAAREKTRIKVKFK